MALALEQVIRERREDAARVLLGDLQEELARLGEPGSFRQLERFFPRYFRHYAGPEAGKPFRLAPFQREFLRELWRRDRYGRRIYTVGLFGIPKGNGKTPLASVLGTHALVSQTDAPEVYNVAGSRDQAGHCYDFARANIEDGALAAWLELGSVIRCPEHRGEYEILSSDGDLAAGVKPSAAIVDEWWLFQHRKQREVYISLEKALPKRPGEAWLLAITTAGFDKASQLGETFDAAMAHPKIEVRKDGFLHVLRDEESGFLFWWYGPSPGADIDIESDRVLRACNPAAWVSPRDLRRELLRPDSKELDWRRLHLNQWTTTREAWLPAGCWAGLRSDVEIPRGAELFVAVDVGLVHDSTAVVWAQRLEDGRVALRAHVFSAVAGVPAHRFVRGGQIDLGEVEQFVVALIEERGYRIRELVYDPRFFERSAQMLSEAGLTVAPLHQSSAQMADAYQAFYQAAREGLLTHDGDPVLRAHVEATGAELTERGWRVRKLRSSVRIDACVAAAMASWRALLATETSYIVDMRAHCACGHVQSRHLDRRGPCVEYGCACTAFEDENAD